MHILRADRPSSVRSPYRNIIALQSYRSSALCYEWSWCWTLLGDVTSHLIVAEQHKLEEMRVQHVQTHGRWCMGSCGFRYCWKALVRMTEKETHFIPDWSVNVKCTCPSTFLSAHNVHRRDGAFAVPDPSKREGLTVPGQHNYRQHHADAHCRWNTPFSRCLGTATAVLLLVSATTRCFLLVVKTLRLQDAFWLQTSCLVMVISLGIPLPY